MFHRLSALKKCCVIIIIIIITCRQIDCSVEWIPLLCPEVPRNRRTTTNSCLSHVEALRASMAMTEVLPEPETPWTIKGFLGFLESTSWMLVMRSLRPWKPLQVKSGGLKAFTNYLICTQINVGLQGALALIGKILVDFSLGETFCTFGKNHEYNLLASKITFFWQLVLLYNLLPRRLQQNM